MIETVLTIAVIALSAAWQLEKMRVRYYREQLAALKTVADNLLTLSENYDAKLRAVNEHNNELYYQLRIFGGKFPNKP